MITEISRTSYTDYQEYKAALDAELQQSTESFVRIGYMLKLARDTDILQGSGYTSVNDFARAEYNIDKTLVSRFISINDRFSEGGNSDRLKEQYRGFGYAKLAIMLQLPDEINEEITPAFSKADVQAIKDEVDAEHQVTDIEVMLEPKSEAQEAMESNLDKAVYQLGHDNPKLYAELMEAIEGEIGIGITRAMQETLAPSGEGIFSIRIMGVGRLLLSVKELDRDITLTNIRTGEKESYTWEQLVAAVGNIMVFGGTVEESYRATYDEQYPVEEKKEVAPVQPKTEPPKPKKQSKVTKSPKTIPKKPELEKETPKEEPERIAPEDVEIVENVENTKCETDFEENETILTENETDSAENETEKSAETRINTKCKTNFEKCGACMFFGKASDAPETVEPDCMWTPSEDNGDERPCVILENATETAEILNTEDFGRLTKSDDLGNWGVKGLPWKELYVGQTITREIHDKLYGCLYKLMKYEETGLSPEEVERLTEKGGA